jgi:Ca-activated chloride channel family protein
VSLSFDNPWALALLLLLPAFFIVGRIGVAYLAQPVRTAAIAIRLLLVAVLALAVAQPIFHRPSDLLSVMYVVDRSASVQVNGANAADGWLSDAVRQAGPNDRTGIVEYGGNALLRRSLGVEQGATDLPILDNQQTNLASALHLASTLFPGIGARRVVVLSDGQSNAGDALAAARQASTRDIHVDVVPIGPPSGFHEAMVESFVAPATVRLGQAFDLSAVVHSTVETDATMTFTIDGKPLSRGNIHLHPGSNRFSVNIPTASKGFHSFAVSVAGSTDTYAENNTADAFTVVEDTGRVAVVASDPKDADAIVSSLQEGKISVSILSPSAIPVSLSAMKQYDSMVLVNTPATSFTLDQTKTIAGFAHDLGRGLVVVGGPQTFGQGKYEGTPLGDALPVLSGVPGNVESGSTALLLVIDKSGSMDENEGGVRKMVMADKAAQLAIGLLSPNDDIGVEAFDTEGTMVIPVGRVGQTQHRIQLQSLVGQISASGGTDIFAALTLAYQQIHGSNAQFKHIILMSDGNSLTNSDYDPLLKKIQDEKITLSTIAIGSDSDKNLMQKLAAKGGGSYYYTEDANKIPEITTKETRVVRGSARVDATFQPQVVAPSPLLESLAGRDLPTLSGYVVTTPRRNTTVALQSDRRDPILSHWNYGLGRVVAWTSDFTPAWGQEWIGWADFNRFWSQAIDWSMRAAGDPNLQFSYVVTGDVVDFRVDVVNDAGVFQDLLNLRARVAGEDGRPVEVPLTQVRPGRYTAQFSIGRPGAYPLEVVEYDAKRQVTRDVTTGIVVPYSAEYRDFGINLEKLASVAAATGGRVVERPKDAYDRSGLSFVGQDSLPLWPWLLALAAILFPADVAIRRLRVDPLNLVSRGIRGGRGHLSHLGGRLSGLGGGLRRRIRGAPVG